MGEKKRIHLYINDEVVKKAKIKAIVKETSVSKVVENFLKTWINSQ